MVDLDDGAALGAGGPVDPAACRRRWCVCRSGRILLGTASGAVDKPSRIGRSFASDSATNLHFHNGILRPPGKTQRIRGIGRNQPPPGHCRGPAVKGGAPTQFRSQAGENRGKPSTSFTRPDPGVVLAMAMVDVAVSRTESERAWALASDLRRFDEWLTIFGGWRSEVPSLSRSAPMCRRDEGEGVPQRHSLAGHPIRRTQGDRAGRQGQARVRIALTLCVKDDETGLDLPGHRRPVRRAAEHPGRTTRAKVLESDVRKSVSQSGRASLTPFVVHGTRFVSRLDGFDSCRAAGATTRSAPSPARRSTAPPTKIATKLLSIGSRVPRWCGRAAPRPVPRPSSFRRFARSRSCSWPHPSRRRRPRRPPARAARRNRG